jgi:hypothetical protein
MTVDKHTLLLEQKNDEEVVETAIYGYQPQEAMNT